MPPRYAEWLRYLFDRPPAPEAWYFDLDIPSFDAEPLELAELIAATFAHCGRDLAPYSDEQLDHGLRYILDNGCSDAVFALKSDDVPMALRLGAISSLKHLYADIFEHRCVPVLAHLDEPGGNGLTYICYMLWDITPLGYWENQKEKTVFYDAVCEALDYAVRSANLACVESGLHGLGHIHHDYPERVEEIIDAFLARGAAGSPALQQYAQLARTGYVL